MNELAERGNDVLAALKSSFYPNASEQSISMVLSYCRAAGLDPMTKPVHIVPMWDRNAKMMRDVIMPGIDLYRTKAARTGQFAGTSEPEFGPDQELTLGGQKFVVPTWCKVTVKRAIGDGIIAEFTAIERWMENYATAKNDTDLPNALFKAFPWAEHLDDARQGVLLNMAFNLGLNSLAHFHDTLALIQSEKWDDAASAMLDSTWAKQVKDRADRLAEQMRTGIWQ